MLLAGAGFSRSTNLSRGDRVPGKQKREASPVPRNGSRLSARLGKKVERQVHKSWLPGALLDGVDR